jgi:hypothetical protein
VQVRAQRDSVIDRAQQVHTRKPNTRQVAAGRRPGCDDDRVGLDGSVIGQQHGRPARRIRPQAGGMHTQMPADVQILGLTLQ